MGTQAGLALEKNPRVGKNTEAYTFTWVTVSVIVESQG